MFPGTHSSHRHHEFREINPFGHPKTITFAGPHSAKHSLAGRLNPVLAFQKTRSNPRRPKLPKQRDLSVHEASTDESYIYPSLTATETR